MLLGLNLNFFPTPHPLDSDALQDFMNLTLFNITVPKKLHSVVHITLGYCKFWSKNQEKFRLYRDVSAFEKLSNFLTRSGFYICYSVDMDPL